MHILVSGGAGHIGKRLVRKLFLDNHNVTVLSRDVERAQRDLSEGCQCDVLGWDPMREEVPVSHLKKTEAIIHLAGESVMSCPWTEDRKKEIRDSRVVSLQKLIQCAQSNPDSKLKVILSSSAIGYYGDRGDETLTEASKNGAGFLAEVCQDLETTLFSAKLPGVRKIAMRIGHVLDKDHGIIETLSKVYHSNLGGPIGSGQQWMSWIHRDDLISLVGFLLKNGTLEGPFNATAPNPVTNETFSKTLAEILGRPNWFRAPAFLVRLAMGRRAELALASQRVQPEKTLTSGFQFTYTEIAAAIQQLFGKSAKLAL